MKKRRICFAAIAVFILGAAAHSLRAEIVDQIVAIINNDTVTYSEVRKVLNPIYSQYQKAYQGEELLEKMSKAKNEVLNQLIENKLLVQEARRRDIQVNSKEIDEHIEKIKARFPNTDKFERVLSAEGMGMDQLRRSVEEQYLTRTLIQQELAPRATVGPGEVEAYYKKNIANYQEEEMVQASHIMIKKTPPPAEGSAEAADTAFEKIKEAQAELKKGTGFEEVAKKYSQAPDATDGGDLGFFSRGKMMKEIEDVAFRIPVGETSDILKTPMGYHLVTVKARREPRTIPLTEVQKDIEHELFQQKTETLRKRWVDDLKSKAYVKILE